MLISCNQPAKSINNHPAVLNSIEILSTHEEIGHSFSLNYYVKSIINYANLCKFMQIYPNLFHHHYWLEPIKTQIEMSRRHLHLFQSMLIQFLVQHFCVSVPSGVFVGLRILRRFGWPHIPPPWLFQTPFLPLIDTSKINSLQFISIQFSSIQFDSI